MCNRTCSGGYSNPLVYIRTSGHSFAYTKLVLLQSGDVNCLFTKPIAVGIIYLLDYSKRGLNMKKEKELSVFPMGEPNDAYAQYFSGQSYLKYLSTEQVTVFNVTFEPTCRNNWHIHHAKCGGGQILICVAGRGWYQEWGKDAIEMHPGDVVNIPQGVKHWHGAAKDSWFQHLAIEVPGTDIVNEWCEPVDDKQYSKLK